MEYEISERDKRIEELVQEVLYNQNILFNLQYI